MPTAPSSRSSLRGRATRLLPLLPLLGLLAAGCTGARRAPAPSLAPSDRYPIVPLPRHLTPRAGELRLDHGTRIVVADSSLLAVAELLAVPLRTESRLPLPVALVPDAGATANAIALRLAPDTRPAGPESYRLDVTARGATLSAPTTAGLLLGTQTVRQLLPPGGSAIPAVEIDDAPRFRYRGILLDVARYYFPPEFLRELVDLLALYKLNVLHLHLTDDQGWRLEIRKYPRLTEVGAWRKETLLAQHFDPYVGDGTPHGGFYTQRQMRDLVAYAAARHVTVVPEIEMPGHAGAALAAYPALSCTGGPFEVSTKWGVHEDVFCPTERTIAFLENVLAEVMEVFPSEYIHIGGDEVPKTRWKASAEAQAIMRREGLAGEEELQSWFTRRIERFLRAHGRKLLGWDEILEGGIAPEATVMSWRGMQGGIDAARQGHDVVMSPGDYAYLDHYQGDPATEPLAICCWLPLDTVYAFEPVPAELTPAEGAHILGVQGNLWTEYIATPSYAEYMLFPRLLALAEVAWSPKEARDRSGFYARLPAHFARLDALGVEYRVPEPEGPWGEQLTIGETARLTIASPVPGGIVRATTDGSEPTAASPVVTGPLVLRVDAEPVTVRARLFLPGGRASPAARARVARATWKEAVDAGAGALRPGLAYAYAERTFAGADEVRDAEPVRVGAVARVGLRGDEREDMYGVRLAGMLRVPQDALYTFHLWSDDGARLRIDGELVVDHDGQHAATEKRGQAALRAGYHRLELVYYEAAGGAELRLDVSAPGMERREVPGEWLAHSGGGAPER